MQTQTKILKVNEINPEKEKIEQGANILKNGGVVAFPTETVYGLGANGLDGQAVEKIFQAKGRPNDNPLILHISSWSELEKLVSFVPEAAKILAEKFWPGPLTLILPKAKHIPNQVTAGLETVGIRWPAHPVALELIKQTGLPIAAPSANLSGKPSPTTACHVEKDLKGKIDLILDGGKTGVGLESTVLDLTVSCPTILRPGGITKEQLENVLGRVELDASLFSVGAKAGLQPKSPGMKYKHYSPEAEVILFIGKNKSDIWEQMKKMALDKEKEGKKVAILSTGGGDYPASIVKKLGDSQAQIASSLYSLLRQMDELSADVVLLEGVEYQGLGLAIMNRMEKAAGYSIIEV